MRRGSWTAVALTAVLILAACAGDSDERTVATEVTSVESSGVVASEPVVTVATSAAGSVALDPAGAEALAVVEAFDPEGENGIDSLNEVIVNGGDIVPALAPLLDDEDLTRRWAAVYVVALSAATPEEIEVLKGALDDPQLELRVSAAGSLSGLGVVESLPVLIEALGSDAQLPYSDPPRPLRDLALEALEAYTGQTFADAAGWQAWWDEVGDSVRWDGERSVTG